MKILIDLILTTRLLIDVILIQSNHTVTLVVTKVLYAIAIQFHLALPLLSLIEKEAVRALIILTVMRRRLRLVVCR